MSGAIPPLPQYASIVCGAHLKHRDNFTFTFTFTSSVLISRLKFCTYFSSLPCMLRAQPILFFLMWSTVIISDEAYKLWSSWLCSLLQPPVIPSIFSPNILLGTLLSSILNPNSFLGVRDEVSHPYETTTDIFQSKFSERRRKDKSFWTDWY